MRDIASLTSCMLFAAAVLAALSSVTQSPPWHRGAAVLYVRFLPAVLVVGALYLAPMLLWVRRRASASLALVAAIPLGCLPGVIVLMVGQFLGAESSVISGIGWMLLGAAVSLVGFGLWLAIGRRRGLVAAVFGLVLACSVAAVAVVMTG